MTVDKRRRPTVNAPITSAGQQVAFEPATIVGAGYDRIAERYATWVGEELTGLRGELVALVVDTLPAGAAVLDLGCGTGVPVSRELARRFRVTGVDLSPRSVALARIAVPAASFIHGDMTALSFPPASFDAVVAFYSIIHVPRGRQADLFHRIAGWLRPRGLLIASLGASDLPHGVDPDWLGTPMFWSHFDAATNVRMVVEAGFEIVRAAEMTVEEHGEPANHLWLAARKLAERQEANCGRIV